jgi:hypothetical protein
LTVGSRQPSRRRWSVRSCRLWGLRSVLGRPCPNPGGMHPRRSAKDLGCLRLSRCSGGQLRDCKDSGNTQAWNPTATALAWCVALDCQTELGCSGSVTRVQLRLLDFEFFVPPAQERPTGGIAWALWDRAAVTMGGRPSLFMGGGVLQGSPRELLLPWGCCHAGACVMRRSCLVLAPGADRGHGLDGRHPGTHYLDREQCPDAAWQAQDRFLPKTVIRPRKPDARSGAEHPVVNQRPAVAVGPRR